MIYYVTMNHLTFLGFALNTIDMFKGKGLVVVRWDGHRFLQTIHALKRIPYPSVSQSVVVVRDIIIRNLLCKRLFHEVTEVWWLLIHPKCAEKYHQCFLVYYHGSPLLLVHSVKETVASSSTQLSIM